MFSMSFTIMQHIHIMHSFDMSAIAGEKKVRCIGGRDTSFYNFEMGFLLYYILSAHTRVKSKFCLTCSQRTNTKITSDSQTTLFFWPIKKA